MKSLLVLSMLQGDDPEVQTFWLTPKFVGCAAFSIGVNQPYVEYIFARVAHEMGWEVIAADNINNLMEPPDGFGYILRIYDQDGQTILVEATYHKVIVTDLADNQKIHVRKYLERFMVDWYLQTRFV